MVKVNIIHMWDFTVMPLQIQAVEVKPTNQELQKQYFDFPLLAILFPAINCHSGTGVRKKNKTKPNKQTKLRKDIKLQKPQTVML